MTKTNDDTKETTMHVDPGAPGGDTHAEAVRIKCPACNGDGVDIRGVECLHCEGACTVLAESKPTAKKPRKVTRKTTVMQMEVRHYADAGVSVDGDPTPSLAGVAWKDMTGEDFGVAFGDAPPGAGATRIQTFKDTAEAKRMLRHSLESGKISGGTFRVAACGKSMTPTVEPKQTNVVSF